MAVEQTQTVRYTADGRVPLFDRVIVCLQNIWHPKTLESFVTVQVFRVVMNCSVAVRYQRLGGPCCVRHEDRRHTGPVKRWF
jgi:hypothetical protein